LQAKNKKNYKKDFYLILTTKFKLPVSASLSLAPLILLALAPLGLAAKDNNAQAKRYAQEPNVPQN
jgi:hypothetical protein